MSDVEELNAILDEAVEAEGDAEDPATGWTRSRGTSPSTSAERRADGLQGLPRRRGPRGVRALQGGLDRYLPPEYSTRRLLSRRTTTAQLLKEYYLDETEEKEVRKRFTQNGRAAQDSDRHREAAHRLRRADPLLHVSGQADARPRAAPGHRPRQPALRGRRWTGQALGFVLDFVGIFEKLEKALAFDSDVVASVIQNVDVLREAFKRDMRETAPQYLQWARGRDDKAKERAVEHFNDKNTREEFYRAFKQIQTLYTILSPDAELRPFIEDYQALAELYGWVRSWFEPHPYRDEEVTEKTKRLLREHTTAYNLQLPGEIRELGPKELAALKASDASDTVKVLNLSKVLAQLVADESGKKPFLLPIGERAEAVRREYENRQMSTREALAEFEKLAEEYVQADSERERMGLDGNAYGILKTLQPLNADLTPAQAQSLDAIFARFPDYQWNEQQKSQLRAELYKVLLTVVSKDKIIQAANALLNLQRV